eukprot:1644610-Pyramimonas_sp.AAC.1
MCIRDRSPPADAMASEAPAHRMRETARKVGESHQPTPFPFGEGFTWTWNGGGVTRLSVQDGSKRGSESSRWLPRWLKIAQYASKWPPGWSKRPQERSKTAPRGPRNPQGGPQDAHTLQKLDAWTSRWASRWPSPKRGPIEPRDGPKRAQFQERFESPQERPKTPQEAPRRRRRRRRNDDDDDDGGVSNGQLFLTLRVSPPAHPETTPRRVEVTREVRAVFDGLSCLWDILEASWGSPGSLVGAVDQGYYLLGLFAYCRGRFRRGMGS